MAPMMPIPAACRVCRSTAGSQMEDTRATNPRASFGRAPRRTCDRGQGDDAPARRERRRGDDREVAQAAGRPCRQVRAARRGDHGQGQRRGPVAVRGRAATRSWPRKARRSPTTPRSRSSRPPTMPVETRHRLWRSRRRAGPRRKGRPRSSYATPMRPPLPRVRRARRVGPSRHGAGCGRRPGPGPG